MRPRGKTSAAGPDVPLQISNPDKVFWPDEGYTKLDLIRFYVEVFEPLKPYVKDRLLSLERCPDGMAGECFYQKQKPPSMPADTPTQPVRHEKGTTNYVVGGKLVTQLALVNLGCIAIHVWGSRKQNPRKPDWVCFDLDPDSGKFADAARAGIRLKEALSALKLVSYPKTSGKKGLHVFVPIQTGPDADEVRGFAETLGQHLSQAYRNEMTMESRIAARQGAPVSTPLAWSEVRPTLDPSEFNLGNFGRRLAKKDPWEDFFENRQPLAPALRAVRSL